MNTYGDVLVSAAIACTSLTACADRLPTAPRPIAVRRLRNDSMRLGAVIVVCRPADLGCIPAYAVACKDIPIGDAVLLGRVANQPLPPDAALWCLRH